jgi:glucose-6-phosphate 1-dehydrogenase
LNPNVVISAGARVKAPGESMTGQDIELDASRQNCDEMLPYERLLGDAIRGDPSLFARQDSVEAAWRVVDPILGNVTPVHDYDPHTWGPAEAERLIEGGGWHNPK